MGLHEIHRVLALPLAFGLDSEVPSQEAIQHKRKALDSVNADRVFYCGMAAWLGMLIMGSLAVTILLTTLLTGLPNAVTAPRFSGADGAVVALVLLFLYAILGRLYTRCRAGHEAWNAAREELEALPRERCAELLQACVAAPECEAYRQKVLAEGREFVVAEYLLLTRWAAGADARHACTALYGAAATNVRLEGPPRASD